MKEKLTEIILKEVLLMVNTNKTYREKAELIAGLVIKFYEQEKN